MTKRAARFLQREGGEVLEWIDVTVVGDREPMVLILTPCCDYCGRLSPAAQCRSCGASVVRAS